jgi:hypothetical protein
MRRWLYRLASDMMAAMSMQADRGGKRAAWALGDARAVLPTSACGDEPGGVLGVRAWTPARPALLGWIR